MHMLVENATLPWGQSWERVFHKHSCIQFIALVPMVKIDSDIVIFGRYA